MTVKLKVYELAKELGVEAQTLVEQVQRLGIDVKGLTSVLGTEEVKLVRDHHRKNKPLSAATKKEPGAAPVKSGVTEKRVGATVIRRRASAKPTQEEKEEVPVVPEPEEAPLEASPVVEAPVAEVEETQAPEVEAAPEAPVEVEAEAPAEEPVAAAPQEPEAPVAKVEKPTVEAPKPVARRAFPSIVKRVSTESHLSEKVGPKVVRPKREETPKPPTPRTRPAGTPGAAGTTSTSLSGGVRRVKEVELVAPQTEAQKEASRRRLAERQSTVFKSADFLKRELVHSMRKKKNAITRPSLKTQITKAADHKRVVEMGKAITVADLANQLGMKSALIITKLMGMGVTAAQNQLVDHDTATLVATEYGFEVKQKMFREEDFVPPIDVSPEKTEPRGPVVTIMGHVDHGKTSLLDAIRKTNVASGEAGGITQHVGAYYVDVPNKGRVTFIDTPGHEAFTAMRARGAKVTDVVVLVVSAADGVMPQTLESVDHAKAAGVPIVVAVNKIDLPDANPDRIKQTLSGHGLAPEEWGGDTLYIPVSAKTGKGIDTLLDSILLQAEVLELKANYNVPARGTVVESRLDKNKGALASVLVQHGRLKPGQMVVCGTVYGKVRAMSNDRSPRLDEALPGVPVEILGLSGVPNVGDVLLVVDDEKAAKNLVEKRSQRIKEGQVESRPKLTLEDMLATATTDKELRVILKADVQGSVEALRETLTKLPSEKVKLKLLHSSTGGVTESDVMLAAASQAAILGFNVRPDIKAQKLAEAEGVELRTYTIIYDMLDDLKKMLLGLVDKKVREKVIGRAEIRNIFTVPKIGTIAGSAVLDGKVTRGCFLRLLRDNRVVYEGKLSSLKRFKDDVKEVAQGFECGIGLENFNDLKLGDQFEAFVKEEIAETAL